MAEASWRQALLQANPINDKLQQMQQNIPQKVQSYTRIRTRNVLTRSNYYQYTITYIPGTTYAKRKPQAARWALQERPVLMSREDDRRGLVHPCLLYKYVQR